MGQDDFMGSSVRASCHCGFKAAYSVGGSMSSHKTHSYFPYYCSPCGMVSVNISADALVCPNGKRHKLTKIAGSWSERLKRENSDSQSKMRRLEFFLGLISFHKAARNADTNASPNVICQWGDHELYDQAYPCPYCRMNTLRFSVPLVRFD